MRSRPKSSSDQAPHDATEVRQVVKSERKWKQRPPTRGEARGPSPDEEGDDVVERRADREQQQRGRAAPKEREHLCPVRRRTAGQHPSRLHPIAPPLFEVRPRKVAPPVID